MAQLGLETVSFTKGSTIITEGREGEYFYVIEQGSCEFIRSIENNGKKNKLNLRTLKAGSHFGELALIRKEPRSLTVKALDEVKLIRLNKAAFEYILPTIQKYLKMDYGVATTSAVSSV